MEIQEWIITRRIEMGISKRELCSRAGITEVTLWNLLKGNHKPIQRTRDAILGVIGQIPEEDLNRYIESSMWQGKAGGYNLSERHSAGWPLTWQGDPTSVMGLPMHRLTVELTRK